MVLQSAKDKFLYCEMLRVDFREAEEDPPVEPIDVSDKMANFKTSRNTCAACHDMKLIQTDKKPSEMSQKEREDCAHDCSGSCKGFRYCHFIQGHWDLKVQAEKAFETLKASKKEEKDEKENQKKEKLQIKKLDREEQKQRIQGCDEIRTKLKNGLAAKANGSLATESRDEVMNLLAGSLGARNPPPLPTITTRVTPSPVPSVTPRTMQVEEEIDLTFSEEEEEMEKVIERAERKRKSCQEQKERMKLLEDFMVENKMDFEELSQHVSRLAKKYKKNLPQQLDISISTS